MQNAWLWMLVPALVAVAGGLLALVWHPSAQGRSHIQHFAAGIVLAALSVEVLPEISRGHAYGPYLIAAFALGSVLMYGMKLWSVHLEHTAEQSGTASLSMGLILATFIDVAMDGFIIGAGFAAGENTGAILAIGLSVELLFLGLSLISEQLRGWRIVALTAGLGLTVLGSTVLGKLLLAGSSHMTIAIALAFSAAALLYLVTEELLIEAHDAPGVTDKPLATLVLFTGFLVFWSISLLG